MTLVNGQRVLAKFFSQPNLSLDLTFNDEGKKVISVSSNGTKNTCSIPDFFTVLNEVKANKNPLKESEKTELLEALQNGSLKFETNGFNIKIQTKSFSKEYSPHQIKSVYTEAIKILGLSSLDDEFKTKQFEKIDDLFTEADSLEKTNVKNISIIEQFADSPKVINLKVTKAVPDLKAIDTRLALTVIKAQLALEQNKGK